MLVFRKKITQGRPARCAERLEGIGETLSRAPSYEGALDLLMEWGEFETGVADFLFPREDSFNELSSALREAGEKTGEVFLRSWEGDLKSAAASAKEFLASLKAVRAMRLPEVISIREPEGFAHYGLYPETYVEAARRFYSCERPSSVVCVGLRSIGTSLSSVVAAALKASGCEVSSYTIRPREHPFRRKTSLSARLSGELKRREDAFFVIVDEGPGMSGTSFTGAAEALSRLGVRDSRIVFFPSWETDGSGFVNNESRKVWNRHRSYCAGFDDIWVKSGRLAASCGARRLMDLSAGAWRRLFYPSEKHYPAAHPYHEKRKFLAADGGGLRMLRFAGHGVYGRGKLERAEELHRAGFSPRPLGLKSGFLISDFIDGRPLSANDKNQVLFEEMARYLVVLRSSFKVPHEVPFDEFASMIRRNITLGLGREWASTLGDIERFRTMYEDAATVAPDGRMLPNDWLLTGRGYMKADSVDHHADQFFPRSLDTAWDIAGALIEFSMTPMEEDYFIGKYRALSGDRSVRERLPFYEVAYLAYRLGFTTFAAGELVPSPDGLRFEALRRRYALELKRKIISAST